LKTAERSESWPAEAQMDGSAQGRGGATASSLQDQREKAIEATKARARATPVQYHAKIRVNAKHCHSGACVRVEYSIQQGSLAAGCAASHAIQQNPHPAFDAEVEYDSDDGSPSDRDFLAVYAAGVPGGGAGGRHCTVWLPFLPSGDGATAWTEVHAGQQDAISLLQGKIDITLPRTPGRYVVRLVTRRGQVAGSSGELFVGPDPAAPEAAVVSAPVPPHVSPAAGAVLAGQRLQQEHQALLAEQQAAHGAAVDAGTVTTHATTQDMASVSQWSANSHASQHTAATSVFTYTLLRRFVRSTAGGLEAGGLERGGLEGGRLLVVRPPYALQVNEAIGSSTLFITLPAAGHGWCVSPPSVHVSPSGFASLAAQATHTQGTAILLLWESALENGIDAANSTVSVQGCSVTWRMAHSSRPRRALHLQLEKPPTALLQAEAAALAAAAGALRCATCDAQLSDVRAAQRAPTASWSAWMEHWLCHTEERGHLLPTHEITPKHHQALVTADDFVLHPTAFRSGSVFLRASQQRSVLSQLQYETRSTAARAQAAKQDTLPDVATCSVHCSRCRAVLGETVAVESMLSTGRCSLEKVFPSAFQEHETNDSVQPAVQLSKAECSLLHSTPAEDIEAGVARGSVFSSYEWFLAQVCSAQQVHRDMCASYSWARLVVRRALEESTASGRYRTLLHCGGVSVTPAALELRLLSWAAVGAAAAAPVAFSVLDKGRFLRMEPNIAPASRQLMAQLYSGQGGYDTAAAASSSSSRQLENMSRLCTFKWRPAMVADEPAGDDNTVVLQVTPHVLEGVRGELQALQAPTPQQANTAGWKTVWVPMLPINS